MPYTDEQRAYHRAYYEKRRQTLIDYLGGKCVECGTTEDLEFDHVDRAAKTRNISSNLTLDSIREELDRCQLLCRPHHVAKTIRETQPYRHGTTYAAITKKCRCPACTVFLDLYNAERRAKRATSGYTRGPYEKNPDHGTFRRYKRGCRCDDCRAANTERARQRRATQTQ